MINDDVSGRRRRQEWLKGEGRNIQYPALRCVRPLDQFLLRHLLFPTAAGLKFFLLSSGWRNLLCESICWSSVSVLFYQKGIVFLKVLRKGFTLTKNNYYLSSGKHSPEKTLFNCQFFYFFLAVCGKEDVNFFVSFFFLSSSGMHLMLEIAAQNNPCSFSIDFQPTPHVLR